jgi:TetR/AcrR family transcriptional regulator, mexJK operon transcriptional repressor
MDAKVLTPGGETGRSARKRRAILDSAAKLFLRNGFLGTSMDEVAALANVSKQTVYKQFASKESLFLGVVRSMTGAASDEAQTHIGDPHDRDQLVAVLTDFAERQLEIVLAPALMQLRRLVIGEAGRFPDLGRALHDGGPGRAIAGLASAFARWAERGLLVLDDPKVAAAQFNWLLMGEPISRAMLLGDEGIPDASVLRRHAAETVRMFVAAYPQRSRI